jgi:serine/threonine protein kinase
VALISREDRVTETNAIVGTFDYLSPEALNGDLVDHRTDIWAFGVLLYEMLTGDTSLLLEKLSAKPSQRF